MILRRFRLGELTIALGVAGVASSLLLSWYQTPDGNVDAWNTFGVAVALLILSALVGLFYVLATLAERTTAIPVATMVWSTVFGFIGTIAAIVRLLERPEHASALCAGPWVALLGTVLIVLGSWRAMHDERTALYPPARPPAREL